MIVVVGRQKDEVAEAEAGRTGRTASIQAERRGTGRRPGRAEGARCRSPDTTSSSFPPICPSSRPGRSAPFCPRIGGAGTPATILSAEVDRRPDRPDRPRRGGGVRIVEERDADATRGRSGGQDGDLRVRGGPLVRALPRLRDRNARGRARSDRRGRAPLSGGGRVGRFPTPPARGHRPGRHPDGPGPGRPTVLRVRKIDALAEAGVTILEPGHDLDRPGRRDRSRHGRLSRGRHRGADRDRPELPDLSRRPHRQLRASATTSMVSARP